MQNPQLYRFEKRLFLINGIMPDGSTKPIAVVAENTPAEAGRKIGYGVLNENDQMFLMTGEHDQFIDELATAIVALNLKAAPVDQAGRFSPSKITLMKELRQCVRLTLVEVPFIE